jgi:hypothetical protein
VAYKRANYRWKRPAVASGGCSFESLSVQKPPDAEKSEIEAGFAKDIAQPKSIYQFLTGPFEKSGLLPLVDANFRAINMSKDGLSIMGWSASRTRVHIRRGSPRLFFT